MNRKSGDEFEVQLARHENIKLRMAIAGGPKTGKSDGALSLATYLAKRAGLKPRETIVMIDAEERSSLRLAKSKARRSREFDFQVIHLSSPYSPERYIAAIRAAIASGAEYIIVDGISPEWNGTGGALEKQSQIAAASRSGNSYVAWSEVTPIHNRFVDIITHCPANIICTMRSRTERVLEAAANGKMKPRTIGLGYIQRNGMAFEFDIVGDTNTDLGISFADNTRCPELNGLEFSKQEREDVWKIIGDWLEGGIEEPEQSVPQSTTTQNDSQKLKRRSLSK